MAGISRVAKGGTEEDRSVATDLAGVPPGAVTELGMWYGSSDRRDVIMRGTVAGVDAQIPSHHHPYNLNIPAHNPRLWNR